MSVFVFLIPIGFIAFLLVCLFVLFTVLRKNEKSNKDEKVSANTMTNIRDIYGSLLYTLDNQIIAFLRIKPMITDMMSDEELEVFIRNATVELSADGQPFFFSAVSKEMDLRSVQNLYRSIVSRSDEPVVKNVLQNSIYDLTQKVDRGEFTDRDYFFRLYSKDTPAGNEELQERIDRFIRNMGNVGLKVEQIGDREIAELINRVHNPTYVGSDSLVFEPYISKLETSTI